MEREARRLTDYARVSFERLIMRRVMFAGGSAISLICYDLWLTLAGIALCIILDILDMRAAAATLRARSRLSGDPALCSACRRRMTATGVALTLGVVWFTASVALSGPADMQMMPMLFLMSASLYWMVSQHQMPNVTLIRLWVIGGGLLAAMGFRPATTLPPPTDPMWVEALTTGFVFYFITVGASAYRTSYERHLDQIDAIAGTLSQSERANAHLSDLLRLLSHELRTPLNGVLGMSELMRLNALPDAASAQLSVLRSSAERLGEVLDDVMDSERLEAGEVRIRKAPTALAPLLEEAMSRHEEAAEEKGLTLVLHIDEEAPEHVIIDGVRLTQCLSKLIDNAVKFTSQGEVRISAAHHETVGLPMLRIEVADSGRGMTADQVASLFGRFEQGNMSASRSEGGLGLGLWIAQGLAKRMGGAIEASSEEGRGSVFAISVIAEAEAATEELGLRRGAA
ncbi:MAG: ATP-binding protein [Pseudomonadota bacterium]